MNADRGVSPSRRKGASVHVDAMRQAFARIGARVVGLDIPDAQALRERLEKELQDGQFDLVYERHALGALAASEFARAHGVPHVIEVNAPLAVEESLYRAGQLPDRERDDERAYFGSAALVVCVSTECARYAIERGANPARVVVEQNAVDPDLFRPRPDDALRNTLAPSGALVVGFHGRLRPWHNFGLLVRALDALIVEGLQIHLLALGEGDFAAEIGSSRLRDHATVVGWRPHAEAAAIVACMDVVPLTYSPDAPFWYSPLKLLEAMAVGATPVVPRLGDLPQTVVHGVDGLCYQPGDAMALQSAIQSLHVDAEWRRWLGRNARRHAEGCTWEALARRVSKAAQSKVTVG